MPITYADGRVAYVSESPLGVAYVRQSNRADGSPGDLQYYDATVGGWDNAYDPAKHLRPFDRAPDDATDQSFAAPADVVDDPTARARVYVLDSKGLPLSLRDQLGSNHLHSLTRRYASRP